LASQVAKASEASKKAEEVIDVLALGGALTAFITHEMGEVLRAVRNFLRAAGPDAAGAEEARTALRKLEDQLTFAKAFGVAPAKPDRSRVGLSTAELPG